MDQNAVKHVMRYSITPLGAFNITLVMHLNLSKTQLKSIFDHRLHLCESRSVKKSLFGYRDTFYSEKVDLELGTSKAVNNEVIRSKYTDKLTWNMTNG